MAQFCSIASELIGADAWSKAGKGDVSLYSRTETSSVTTVDHQEWAGLLVDSTAIASDKDVLTLTRVHLFGVEVDLYGHEKSKHEELHRNTKTGDYVSQVANYQIDKVDNVTDTTTKETRPLFGSAKLEYTLKDSQIQTTTTGGPYGGDSFITPYDTGTGHFTTVATTTITRDITRAEPLVSGGGVVTIAVTFSDKGQYKSETTSTTEGKYGGASREIVETTLSQDDIVRTPENGQIKVATTHTSDHTRSVTGLHSGHNDDTEYGSNPVTGSATYTWEDSSAIAAIGSGARQKILQELEDMWAQPALSLIVGMEAIEHAAEVTVDFAIGVWDGAVASFNPISFWVEIPPIGPIFGNETAYAVGNVTGHVVGIAAQIYLGNVAAAGSGLAACGGLAQNAAKLYGVVSEVNNIAQAASNIAEGKGGVMDYISVGAPAFGFALGTAQKVLGKGFCFRIGTQAVVVLPEETTGVAWAGIGEGARLACGAVIVMAAGYLVGDWLERRKRQLLQLAAGNFWAEFGGLDRLRENRVADSLYRELAAGCLGTTRASHARSTAADAVWSQDIETADWKSDTADMPGFKLPAMTQPRVTTAPPLARALPRDVQRPPCNRSTPDKRPHKLARGRSRFWAMGLLLAALGGWFALPPLCSDRAADRHVAGTVRLSTKAIELVRPGERTKGINPDASGRTAGLGDFDPATHRLVTLQQREEGVVVFRGSTIRPSAEMDELGARPGASIDLALAEFGCDGPVEVAAVERWPNRERLGNAQTGRRTQLSMSPE